MSLNDERRTVAELALRYQLHPEFRDVYVEGDFDVDVLDWYFGKRQLDDAVVYRVGTIAMPATDLLAHDLPDGERSRAILLAVEMERLLGRDQKCVTTIADRDLDFDLTRSRRCASLLYTDFSCMEMYAFQVEVLSKFFRLVCALRFDVAAAMRSLEVALQELFLLRLANEELNAGLSGLPFVRCCEVRAGIVLLDIQMYVERWLDKNARRDLQVSIARVVDTHRGALPKDPRLVAHGHDFTVLVHHMIERSGRQRYFASDLVIGRVLVGCLEADELVQHPMFRSLESRVA